ncbi:MAG: hypothetical protein V1492_02540 [Candidatus Micrarchaeota archaeon]
MTYESSIKLCKLEIEEYSKNMRKEDVEWIRQKLIEYYAADLQKYEDKNEREYKILYRLSNLLYSIIYNKPPNIREYVERYLKKEEYGNKLEKIMTRDIQAIKPGDASRCDEVRKKIENLLEEAEKEVPGFRKDTAFSVSEMMGDILAKQTHGFAGSARMVNWMGHGSQKKIEKFLTEVVKKPKKKTPKKKTSKG